MNIENQITKDQFLELVNKGVITKTGLLEKLTGEKDAPAPEVRHEEMPTELCDHGIQNPENEVNCGPCEPTTIPTVNPGKGKLEGEPICDHKIGDEAPSAEPTPDPSVESVGEGQIDEDPAKLTKTTIKTARKHRHVE